MVYIYFFLIFFSTLLVFIFLCTVLRRTFFYFGLIREEKIQQYSLFSYEEKETFYWSNHIHFSWIFFYKTKSRRVQSNYCTLQHHFLPLFPIRHIFPFLFMIITWSQRERRQIRRAHDADEDESHNPIFGRWTFNSGNSFFFCILFFCGWIFSSFHFLLLSACRSFPPMLIWKRASCALILILHRLKYFFVLESGFFFTERRKANWRWCGSQQTGKS